LTEIARYYELFDPPRCATGTLSVDIILNSMPNMMSAEATSERPKERHERYAVKTILATSKAAFPILASFPFDSFTTVSGTDYLIRSLRPWFMSSAPHSMTVANSFFRPNWAVSTMNRSISNFDVNGTSNSRLKGDFRQSSVLAISTDCSDRHFTPIKYIHYTDQSIEIRCLGNGLPTGIHSFRSKPSLDLQPKYLNKQ
jgi:hypothetical protein